MFRGIYELNLDAKGRLAIPTRYRDALVGEDKAPLIVTIDTEEACLLLYPKPLWENIEVQLQKLPSFNAQSRRIQRLLIGHATEIELDNSGRVVLPPPLRDYAKLTKSVVMIGQGTKFEIWDAEEWATRRAAWLEQAAQDGDLPVEMQTFSL